MSSLFRIMGLSIASIVLLALSAFGGVSIYKQLRSNENRFPKCHINRTWIEGEPGTINLSQPDINVPIFHSRFNPFAGNDCGYIDSDNRIFAGNLTQLFEFPWMVLLGYSNTNALPYPFLCAGSLITDRHVLTAAHCLNGVSGMELQFVRLGEHDLRTPIDCEISDLGEEICAPPHVDMSIRQTIAHPDFNNRQNDIAIIVLAQPVDTSQEHIKKVCLPFDEHIQSTNLMRLVAAGWGVTENGTSSDVLMKTFLPLVTNDECQRIYRNEVLSARQFCAGGGIAPSSRGNTCLGDSGGPVQMIVDTNVTLNNGEYWNDLRYHQFGVVSMGPALCWARGQPGIHTRVINFLPWIRDVVQETWN